MGIPFESLGQYAKEQVMAKLAIEEARRRNKAHQIDREKANKLHAQKVQAALSDGTPHTFASKREYARYQELSMMEKSGEISDLRIEVPYELVPAQTKKDGTKERPLTYRADFVYRKNGETVVEDTKGYRNPSSAVYRVFAAKRKLMLWRFGIEVKEV